MDPISLEVIYNATGQIIRELTNNMVRTGFSTIIKEMQDITFAICDYRGRLVGQYFVEPVHLGVIEAQVYEIIRRYKADINPEDSFIVNHPYQYCQNHSTDITLISPIFYNSRLVGYVGNTAHKPDIGGKVPGTNAGDATDVFQEGLLIPPLKLYKQGELNREIYEIITCNSRTPEITWGDIKAQALTNIYGAKKVVELMDKFGCDEVLECWKRWIKICEDALRKEISRLPDGVYGPVTDYMDDDGIELGVPLEISVKMEKKDDELHFIFSSSKQARGPINIRPCLTKCVTEYCVKAVLVPDLPNNHGSSLPVKITLPPEGYMLNPKFPAPVNMYAITSTRIAPIVMMVLAQAVPDRVAAPASGALGAISFAGANPRTGRWYTQFEILAGGYGGRPNKDGISGMDADATNNKNTPIEAVETEFPVIVEKYELIPDSESPGLFRGGLGVRRDWKILSNNVNMNLRTDRFEFSSPGIFGASPAVASRCILNPDSEDRKQLHSKISNFNLKFGDVLRWELGGGGGWGRPFERDPELVLNDVLDGYISIHQAMEKYGVAINPHSMTVDMEATHKIRGK